MSEVVTPTLRPTLPDEPLERRGAVASVQDLVRYDGDADWFVKARLKMRQLLLLIALDDHRNIHRAAEEINITQPSASKQIMELEALLGVKLFKRLPRGMEPTVFGDIMIQRARIALSSMILAHGDVMALRSGRVGQVEIGTISAPVMGVLPRAIAQVKKQTPNVNICVHVDTSNVLLERVRAGSLDFMIGRLGDDAQGLVYEEFAEEQICAVARTGHPLLERERIDLQDLVEAPWILPARGTILRSRFERLFHRDGLPPPSDVIESTSLPLIVALLREADALHIMPVEIANYYASLGAVAVLPIELDCGMDAFGLIRRQDRVTSPCANLLLNALRHLARDIGWMRTGERGAKGAAHAFAAGTCA